MSTHHHDDTNGIVSNINIADAITSLNINNKTQFLLTISESEHNSSSYDRFSNNNDYAAALFGATTNTT